MTDYVQNIVHVFERLFELAGVLALLGGSLFFQKVLIAIFQAMEDDLAGGAFLRLTSSADAFELVRVFNAFLPILSLWLPMIDIRKSYFLALLDGPIGDHELPFSTKLNVCIGVAAVVKKIAWEVQGCTYPDLLCVSYAERVRLDGEMKVEDQLEILG